MFIFACGPKAELTPYVKYQSDADVPRMPLEDAKKEYDNGRAVIVDARPEPAYKQEHIAGSMNIPIGSPPERFKELPTDKKIIVYCS